MGLIAYAQSDYVDLGLPSGTLWCSKNENGYFSYDMANSRFRQHLPSYEQLKELKTKCQWKWTDGGYVVTGPNGNSIFLPAEGYVHPSNNGDKTWEQKVGGHYWAEKRYGEHLTELRFSSDWIVINVGDGCLEKMDKASIRLVKTR